MATAEGHHKLYGRDADISYLTGLLSEAGRRILIRGPSGIGKTELVRTLSDPEHGISTQPCLTYQVESNAHTANHLLQELTVQLLDKTELPRPKIRSVGRSLIYSGRDHSWSLATAALLDAVGAIFPASKKVGETIVAAMAQESSTVIPAATVEKLKFAASPDLVAGFLNLATALDSAGTSCTVIVDRLEASSNATESAVLALAAGLPESWSMAIAINDEVPEGIDLINRIWPQLAYRGALNYPLGPLNEYALERWSWDRHGEAPSLSELKVVVRNCEGRPLLMREWIEGSSDQAEYVDVWSRLGPYYAARMRALPPGTRKALVALSLLPVQSSFELPLIRDILGASTLAETFDVVDELVRAQFLELARDKPDQYIFVHDVTRYQISRITPRPVLVEAAQSLLNLFRPHHATSRYELTNYARAILAREAQEPDEFVRLALPEADRLASQGALRTALELYEMCIVLPPLEMDPDAHFRARYGISDLLYGMGYYQEALARLPGPLSSAPSSSGHVALLQGRVLLRLNRYGESQSALDRARVVFEELGEGTGIVSVAKEENTILRDLGRYEEAVEQAQELVSIAEATSIESRVLGSCYRALARSWALKAEMHAAVSAANKALDVAVSLGSVTDAGNCHLALGEALRHGKRFSLALEEYRQALSVAETVGNRDSLLWSALGSADCWIMLGNLRDATTILNMVGKIVSPSPVNHPLEHLHWGFASTVTKFLSGQADAQHLRQAAYAYKCLNISWPTEYADKVIANLGTEEPMRF
ncbi:AAA family ATPase [Micromonospora chersina]|uniref:AAA family ATPase n=1 Tax=Micromonospora chersina TaxID=47854 RepID=UPI00371B8CA5